jgi:hypothetical protein
MLLKRAIQPLLGLVAVASLTLPAVAQTPGEKAEPLSQPSVPEAVEKVTGQEQFWQDRGILANAKWLFGFDYGEIKLNRQAQRFEMLYTDLLKQQSENQAIIRTQDIVNPFGSSLLESPTP